LLFSFPKKQDVVKRQSKLRMHQDFLDQKSNKRSF